MGRWPSVGLGVGFGLLHLALIFLTHQIARRLPRHTVQIELAGVVARLLIALVAVVVVLVAVPVEQGAFVLAFLLTFAVGLVVDTARLVRRAIRASHSRPA